MTQFLTVKAVSKLSGISAHTLRAWERRYNAVSPKRTETGRRFYTNSDVERLKLLGQLVDSGYGIGGIANLSDRELSNLAKKLEPNSNLTQSIQDSNSNTANLETLTADLLDSLQDFEIDKLSKNLNYARLTLPIKSFVLDIVSPLMGMVGEKVASGKLSIAQEHILSANIRDHLGQIMQSLGSSNIKSKTFLFSTREGDIHEFGILLSAILCIGHGFKVHYLGPNIPAKDLIVAAKKLKADVVILGTVQTTRNLNKISLSDYIEKIDQSLGSHTKIIVGGQLDHKETLPKSKRIQHINSLQKLDEVLSKF